MLKKVGIFLGLVLSALVLAVGGLYAKGGSAVSVVVGGPNLCQARTRPQQRSEMGGSKYSQ